MSKQGIKEDQNYISLQEATKYCPYSQDYLSLRARQGKLKSIKIGRNWVTTKEWIEEYLEKAKEYNNNHKVTKTVAPPENLPITDKSLRDIVAVEIVNNSSSPEKASLFIAFALICLLLITGIAFGKDSIKSAFEDANPYAVAFNQRVDEGIVNSWQGLQEGIPKVGQIADKGIINSWAGINNIVQATAQTGDSFLRGTAKSFEESFTAVSKDIYQFSKDFSRFGGETIFTIGKVISSGLTDINQLAEVGQRASGSIFETIKGTGQGTAEGIKGIGQGVKNIVLSLIKDISRLVTKPKEEIPEEPIVPKPAGEGLVVIPSTAKDEEVKKKIKESFSDEVRVEPKDETSGIIVPVFREREGEKYLYILVPLRY